MRPRIRGPVPICLVALCVVALCACALHAAGAQLVRLTPNSGEAGVESRAERTSHAGQRGAATDVYGQWFSLPLSGSVLSPRFLSYGATFRPVWGQASVTGQSRADATLHVDMSVSANFLPASRLSLAIQSHRSSGSARSGFGGETSFQTGGFGGTLRLRSQVFPVFAEWSTRSIDDLWRATADQVPLHRDETLRTFRLTGQSSKLATTFERTRFTDRIGTLSFSSTGARAVHGLRWGKGSNVETSVETTDREGSDSYHRRSLGERVRLMHTRTLTSDYAVQWRRTREGGFAAGSTSGSASGQYRVSGWSTASLVASGTSSTFSGGQIRNLAVTPSIALTIKMPASARFVGSLSGGYERTNQHLTGLAWIQVTDELHVVDETRRWLLAHEAVDEASLQVHSRDHTVAYLRDVDFHVTVLGDFLRIEILPAGRLAPGDGVTVGYRYTVPQGAQHDQRTIAADAALSRGGLSLRQSVAFRRSRALQGEDDGRFGSGDDFVTRAELHRDSRLGRIDVDVERRVRVNSRADFSTSELRLAVLPPALAGLQAAGGAATMRTSMNGQDVTLVSLNAALRWSPTPGLHAQTSAEQWLWSPRGQRAEKLLSWTLDIGWTFGRFETEWRYAYQRRLATADGMQHRFSGRLTRHF